MGYVLSLIMVLASLWLTLSGYFHDPLLLSFGVLSVAICVFVMMRFRILDDQGVPYHRLPYLFGYWVWLLGEIIKSNFIVAAVILRPDMVLTPRMVRVKTLPKSEFGRALFANSITLTPGTVSIDLDDDEIIVHSMLKELTAKAGFAEMARRCARAAGEKGVGP